MTIGNHDNTKNLAQMSITQILKLWNFRRTGTDRGTWNWQRRAKALRAAWTSIDSPYEALVSEMIKHGYDPISTRLDHEFCFVSSVDPQYKIVHFRKDLIARRSHASL